MEEATFSDWTNRIKAFNEFVANLGAYKLNVAKASLEWAKAEEKRQLIRARELVIRKMETALDKMEREKERARKLAERVEVKRTYIKRLVRGNFVESSNYTRAKSAYSWFITEALLESETDLYEITLPSTAYRANNFINCRSRGSETVDLPVDITTALEMVDWLFEKRYVAKLGKPAHRSFLKISKAINKVAKGTITEIKKYAKQIERETLDTWLPLTVLGVQQSSVSRTITQTRVAPPGE